MSVHRWLTACIVAYCLAPLCHAEEKKQLLLLGQKPDGHPPATHEYMPAQRLLASCLRNVDGLETTIVQADDPWLKGPQLIDRADGVVLFVSEGAKWVSAQPRRLEAFARLAERGGGLVVIHWGMGTRDAANIDTFLKLFGGCHGGPDRKYIVVENADFQIATPSHPVVTGVDPFRVPREEFYYRLKWIKPNKGMTPLVRVPIDGAVETVCWAWQRPDGGRSFGFSGLHFHNNWRHEQYRRLMAQAALWTVGLPIPKNGLPVSVDNKAIDLK
jgi:type 1 glutamine amidotransferase